MSNAKEYNDKIVNELTATIAISGTESDAVDISGCTAVGFAIPAAFTGLNVTFKGSMDKGANFVDVHDVNSVLVSYVIALEGGFALDAKTFAPYDQIKVISDDTEVAERLITIKPFII